MPYLQLRFDLGALPPEEVEETLYALGAESVSYLGTGDEDIYEPSPGEERLWSHTRVVALFPFGHDPELLAAALANTFGMGTIPDLGVETLEDRTWESEWIKDLRPMRFGRRTWVVPTGFDAPDGPDEISVSIDPGLAFGTGSHPTTALCLEWLDGAALGDALVVDYGCGSGVLGIAALLLGARQVIAVDMEPQALRATRENASRNGVADRIACFQPDEIPAGTRADIVLANILSGPLVKLQPVLTGLLAPGGRLILSGVLAEQAEAVVRGYRPYLSIDGLKRRDDWVRIAATAPTNGEESP